MIFFSSSAIWTLCLETILVLRSGKVFLQGCFWYPIISVLEDRAYLAYPRNGSLRRVALSKAKHYEVQRRLSIQCRNVI